VEETKTIDSWHDLEQYGIISLTGEACGTGQRLLCDLTPAGVELIESFLTTTIKIGNNWNRREGQVASIMMPRCLLNDLLIYALLREGYEAVISVTGNGRYRSHGIHGMSMAAWEKRRECWNEAYQGKVRLYCGSGTARGGLLNRHEMSGRVG